jgi:ABC-type dipeptide/oligopeptide/nickel transport system permease subunit
MTEQTTGTVEFSEMLPSVNPYVRFLKVFFGRKVVTFGFIIIVGLLFSALFAAQIAPYDPYETDLDKALLKPNWEHLLGTDALGRDTLSRIIYGTRTSLMVGIIAIAIASSVGMTLGLLAGYFGGVVNMIIMRLIDALMAFPIILKALIIAALLGGGLRNVMIALGVGLISVYARLMCGQVLSVRENDYVMAGQVIGASNIRVMLRHVLPNCFPPLIVMLTLNMGAAILAEAGLSFLGIGIEAPGAAWGSMVSDGYQYLLTHPVLSFAPGFAIMLVVLAFNLVGDGLRDALDPRLRGMI